MSRETQSKPVPKFTSFRSKTPQTHPPQRSYGIIPEKDDQQPSKHDERRKGHDPLRVGVSAAISTRQARTRESQSKKDVPVAIDRTFVIDRCGDEENVRYGSLHRYNIPRYHRLGFGRVVGLSPEEKIDRAASTEKTIVVSSLRPYDSSERNKDIFRKLGLERDLTVQPLEEPGSMSDYEADFLRLDPSSARKRRRFNDEDLSTGSSEDGGPDTGYRSTEGKSKSLKIAKDPTSAFELDASAADGVALSRKTEAEPDNGEAWLALINHQGTNTRRLRRGLISTQAELQSTAEIRLSMYERALKHVTDGQYREKLVLGMMEERSKLWESDHLARKWHEILKEYNSCTQLWVKYLDFQQTRAFRYDDMRDQFLECLKYIGDSHIAAYVLLRATSCMRDAGYSENALAIWQALLEYNFCRPEEPHIGQPQTLVECFKDFWDSETARIGEDGAKGWTKHDSENYPVPESRLDTLKPADTMLSSWPKTEREHALEARLVARTTDDFSDDDPFRVVLFSDVEGFLVDFLALQDSVTAESSLLQAFLLYCHLPPLPNAQREGCFWWQDAFIRNEGLDNTTTPADDVISVDDISASSQEHASPFKLPLQNFVCSLDVLFPRSDRWFSAWYNWARENEQNRGPVEIGWVLRTLRILVDRGVGGDDLAELALGFETRFFPGSAKKTAKALLKAQPSNLRLYNAYALIEFRGNKKSVAETVIATAIRMGKPDDVVVLWRTWIWELVEAADTQAALQRLLSMPDGWTGTNKEIIDAESMFRAQRFILGSRDRSLERKDYAQATIHMELLSLLTYLSNPTSLEGTLSTYAANIVLLGSTIPSNSLHHELLYQSRARLLYLHTTRTAFFKPALVRSCLAESVSAFPNNTIFLSLFAYNEARFRMDDRVRSIVQDVLFSPAANSAHDAQGSIIAHSFAIHTEQHRDIRLGSNAHSVRAAFERAVDSKACGHSALLWKWYFLFELGKGGAQRARSVFYRAVRACPWAKRLYMLPFEHLQDSMAHEELRGVYEMMVGDRELRVHISPDERFGRPDGREQ